MMQREQVLTAARAMHHLFEQRAERTHTFYTRTRWEQLEDEYRAEFIDYAAVMVAAIDREGDTP